MSVAIVTPDGMLTLRDRRMRVALGQAGITTTKHEGDRATPCGILPLRRVLFRADRLAMPPRTALPREPIGRQDGWCDDPASRDYNRPVTLPHGDRHEVLWREDGLYDVVAVLGWNDAPVERDRGSAIFLHVARPDFAATMGCVAAPLDGLLGLLAEGLTALDVRAA